MTGMSSAFHAAIAPLAALALPRTAPAALLATAAGGLNNGTTDRLCHGFILALVGSNGGLDPFGAVDASQLDLVPGTLAKLLEVLKLGASIAFAEGVDVVHVTHDLPGGLSKSIGGCAAKKVCGFEAAMNICHAALDEGLGHEALATLADLDAAHLPGPIIDILEEVAMDRLEVLQVEVTFWNALRHSLCAGFLFEPAKVSIIGDSGFISKSVRAGNDVRIAHK